MKNKGYININYNDTAAIFPLPTGYSNLTLDSTMIGEWLEYDGVSNGNIDFLVYTNTTGKTRVGYFIVKYIVDGESVETTIEVRQYPQFIPVCSDTFYNTDASTFSYKISTDDEEIYSGTAVALPAESGLEICVNKICYPYLSTQFPIEVFGGETRQLLIIDNAVKTFYLKNSNGSTIEEYNFLNCWDKNITLDSVGNVILSAPIKKLVDTRQRLLASGLVTTGKVFRIKRDGTNIFVKPSEGNNVFLYVGDNLIEGTYTFNDTVEYEVKNTCYEWCIYYKNLYGGYDSILVDGNMVESMNYSPEMYTTSFNNLVPQAEHHKYLNITTAKYKMYISANDEESSRMKHLFGSTEMYLHNLVTDEILPVLCENNSFERKTYKNQGNHKYTYELNLTAAMDKINR